MPEMLTVATLLFDEDQAAYTFTFCEFPLLHVPLALNWKIDPGARGELEVFTEIELRVAELTVRPLVPVALAPAKLKLALILAVPGTSPFTTPVLLPEVPNAATEELAELHCTEVLMS